MEEDCTDVEDNGGRIATANDECEHVFDTRGEEWRGGTSGSRRALGHNRW